MLFSLCNFYLTHFTLVPLQVLFRLNFLVLVLCVVMDRPYQFYYFVPLVTFWFVVIYGTLAMWPQILQKKANSRFIYVSLSKIHNIQSPRLCESSIHVSRRFAFRKSTFSDGCLVLRTDSGMWHIGVLAKLLGLLMFICFFAYSQVCEFITV